MTWPKVEGRALWHVVMFGALGLGVIGFMIKGVLTLVLSPD